MSDRENGAPRDQFDFRHLLENLPVAIFVLGANGRPVFANASAIEILGRGVHPEATPETLGETYQVYLAGTEHPYPTEMMPIIKALNGETSSVDDMEIHRPDGRIRVRVWATPGLDAEKDITHAIAAFVDITEEKEVEKGLYETQREAAEKAITDELTGLGNRRGLVHAAEGLMSFAEKTGHPLAVVYLDVNSMKEINDNFGHNVGDQALQVVGQVLRRALRDSDYIARVGGDEFCVLMSGGAEGFEQAAVERIRAFLEEESRKHLFPLSVSIGVARFDPEEPRDLVTLLAEADSEMYAQKRQRR